MGQTVIETRALERQLSAFHLKGRDSAEGPQAATSDQQTGLRSSPTADPRGENHRREARAKTEANREIRFSLNQRRRLRDRALFDLALDSKLRDCDSVQMKTGDLVGGGQVGTCAIVMLQKTGRPVQFESPPAKRRLEKVSYTVPLVATYRRSAR